MKYKYDIIQISGFALMVLGAQATVRLIVNPADNALVAWVPGGVSSQLAVGVAATIAGATFTGWAYKKARAQGDREDT